MNHFMIKNYLNSLFLIYKNCINFLPLKGPKKNIFQFLIVFRNMKSTFNDRTVRKRSWILNSASTTLTPLDRTVVAGVVAAEEAAGAEVAIDETIVAKEVIAGTVVIVAIEEAAVDAETDQAVVEASEER